MLCKQLVDDQQMIIELYCCVWYHFVLDVGYYFNIGEFLFATTFIGRVAIQKLIYWKYGPKCKCKVMTSCLD